MLEPLLPNERDRVIGPLGRRNIGKPQRRLVATGLEGVEPRRGEQTGHSLTVPLACVRSGRGCHNSAGNLAVLIRALEQRLSFRQVVQRPHRHLKIPRPKMPNFANIAREPCLERHCVRVELHVGDDRFDLGENLEAHEVLDAFERDVELDLFDLNIVAEAREIAADSIP